MSDQDVLPYSGPRLNVQRGSAMPTDPTVDPASDPYSAFFGPAPPKESNPKAEAADPIDYNAMFGKAPPPDDTPPGRIVGGSEAAVKGIGNALSFGTMPAIAGLSEASGIPSAAGPDEVDLNPARPIMGAVKMLHNYLSDHPDPQVRDAYERGRKSQLNDEQLSMEQHPAPYIMGQLGGALMAPLGVAGAAGKAAGTFGKIGQGLLAGGVGGGLYGAGSAVGEGKDAGDAAIEGAKGAATGAAFGGVASGAAGLIGKGFDKAASIVRGVRDTDAESGSRIIDHLQRDFDSRGPTLGPDEISAANQAGTPRAIIDSGGESTRALARSAANTSPEARAALQEMVQERFQDQSPRVSGFIKQITGGANAAADTEKLENAARLANKPAYDKLMAQHPVVGVPSSISDRPAVAQAMKDAVSLAKNHGENIKGETEVKTILQGDGYHIADDVLNPAKTSLRYWDYVKKALDARIEGMKRSGGIAELNSKEVADFKGLVAAKQALVDHLDSVAKDYKATREGAAAFFKAENALEAGQNFVMSDANINQAKLALAKMSAPEKELFARGFASDLADKIAKIPDNRDVLNSVFLNNGPARQKIEMALGAPRARQLEALLRTEKVIDFARKAVMGNSTTARQMAEHGLGGGVAVGVLEGLKDHDYSVSHMIAGALSFGALRGGAIKIDQKVARRVGEMLASSDPAVLAKGVKIVASTPAYLEGLRRATAAGALVSAHDVGPGRAAAGAATLGMRALEGPEKPDTNPADNAADQMQQ